LAAAGGYVGEAGGAETGEEAGGFAAEELGRDVDQHVAELDGLGGGDVGENFAADGDALLHNPSAGLFGRLGSGGVAAGDWAARCGLPNMFGRFPRAGY